MDEQIWEPVDVHMVEPAFSSVYHDEPLAVGFLREAGIIRTPSGRAVRGTST